jgi:hypothetical protein
MNVPSAGTPGLLRPADALALTASVKQLRCSTAVPAEIPEIPGDFALRSRRSP